MKEVSATAGHRRRFRVPRDVSFLRSQAMGLRVSVARFCVSERESGGTEALRSEATSCPPERHLAFPQDIVPCQRSCGLRAVLHNGLQPGSLRRWHFSLRARRLWRVSWRRRAGPSPDNAAETVGDVNFLGLTFGEGLQSSGKF